MAYATIVSLKQTIGSLLHPSQSKILLPNSEVGFIYREVCDLQSFLEKISSLQRTERVDALQTQIKDAVHKAEDLIESHISDRLLSESESFSDESLTLVFSQKLLKVKQEITSLVEMVKNKDEYDTEDQQPSNSFAADSVSSRIYSVRNNKLVGLEKERNQLKRSLLSGSSKRYTISIVGMIGIGKTALTKEVYHDPDVQEKFPNRCLVTIGPKYHLGEILLRLLDQMDSDGSFEENVDREPGLQLLGLLSYKKYLIVLDDVRDAHLWEQLRKYVPDNGNGSRIILTTRMLDVARNASLAERHVKMPFLNDDESWDLLRDSVFANQESCNPQLEEIGKKIAKTCEGLPLAILAVGSLLREAEKTVQKWKEVEEDENSLIAPISDVLTLSYKELPERLKACFLYIGVFPQNYEIPTSKLKQLWVAERLFEPESSENSEEMAEKCLEDLISRSLVLLSEWSSTGRTKTSRVHFVYRNLCISEARNEKFFHVINKLFNSFPEGTNTQRRLSVHNNSALGLKQVHSSMKSISGARSLLCLGPKHHQYGLQVYLNYRLLKVLNALKIRFYEFPEDVLKLVQLRYLAITYDGELPASISKLRDLVVLIVCRHHRIKWSEAPFYLPMEIWNLHALRHLECIGFELPDPSSAGDGCDKSLILENLLTLSGVSAHSCRQEILARMPNLIKLGIWIDSRQNGVETFSFFGDYIDLHSLESFKWVFVHPYPESRVVFSNLTFSDTLRKITLSGCGFSWKCMTYIGRLLNLQVLKLRCYAFRGPDWVTIDEEFPKLRFLLLEDLDIEQWKVESDDHFPLLKHLIIRHCYKLKDIPSEFIYIPTLDMIEVDDCSPSVVDSVQKLQHIVGNRHLPVQIRSSWEDKTGK